MDVQETDLSGIYVVTTVPVSDERGSFCRLFCDQALSEIVGKRKIVQINQSKTNHVGTVRGMHYQKPPAAEMKLVRCTQGRVFDVAVDLRTHSETYLRWHAEELSPGSHKILVIPEGCAHGFQVLEKNSELLYLHTAAYQPQHEAGILFDDPALAIDWPLQAKDISARDRSHSPIGSDFRGITL